MKRETPPQMKASLKKETKGNTGCISLTFIYCASTMCQAPWGRSYVGCLESWK